MVAIMAKERKTQLVMPGMLDPFTDKAIAGPQRLSMGQQVVYVGRLRGGPRHGSRGVVRHSFGRKAVVDLDSGGTWHIPYYFLSVHARAA